MTRIAGSIRFFVEIEGKAGRSELILDPKLIEIHGNGYIQEAVLRWLSGLVAKGALP